jgi:uncharacterized protein (UPF0335 family)
MFRAGAGHRVLFLPRSHVEEALARRGAGVDGLLSGTSIYQGGTMSDVTIPGGKIRAFVERIENLDTEILELSEQKKEVFAEAKGDGFDVKILKEIIKLRKQDQEERDERESMLDLYMRAMEQGGRRRSPRLHDEQGEATTAPLASSSAVCRE